MTNNQAIIKCDVVVVGGGPSGLSAATKLKQLGVESVIVVEREQEAGGIPRHCGHSLFGFREFYRVYSAKQYTKALIDRAIKVGVEILTSSTVTQLNPDANIEISNNDGVFKINAQRVILATGARETPRSTRLVSGQRPLGITTTGALQSTIYLKKNKPIAKTAVIVGTEMVSFSALLSARHAGIKINAMLEESSNPSTVYPLTFIAKFFRVPIIYNASIEKILGKHRVAAVEIMNKDKLETIDCESVIFTGNFVAESSLLRMSHLQVGSNKSVPIMDSLNRCSDNSYYATGNMTHPVETAGYCWSDGIKCAKNVFESLQSK